MRKRFNRNVLKASGILLIYCPLRNVNFIDPRLAIVFFPVFYTLIYFGQNSMKDYAYLYDRYIERLKLENDL
ncbi:MAG: hypothetical protein ABIQ31_19050 [Ferruginibacter sp.]